MDLYEYRARSLFRQHGAPVFDDAVATTPEEARNAAQSLLNAGSELVVVKAQVKTGGCGKAGGIKLARTAEKAEARARDTLGMGIKGHTMRAALISDGVDLNAKYYFSILLNRAGRQHLAVCSREDGIDIEALAIERLEALIRIDIDPLGGIISAVSHRIVEAADFEAGPLADEIAAVTGRLWEVLTTEDAALVEVSPLVKAADGRIIALDGKVTLGDNSRFRHLARAGLVGNAATDPLETRAREASLNYMRLEGEVGVLDNDAGLVMSTLDVVTGAGERHGGVKPANFLDPGDGSPAEVMATGLEIVASDPRVHTILVNVFGGITPCDTVVQDIVTAVESLGEPPEPAVVRLDDNNANIDRAVLADAAIEGVIVVDTMDGVADVVTAIAEKISGRPVDKEA